MELTVSPILPLWVIAALAVGLLVLLAHGCGLLAQKRVPAGWILALGGLRLLAVVLFVLCLLRPVVGVERNLSPKPDLLVMLDASASMGQKATPDSPPRLKQSVGELIRSGVTRRWYDHHRLHWFGFDRTAYTLPEDRVTRVAADGEGTDLTESLRTAVLSYRQDNAAAAERAQGLRVVLVSDGLDPGHDDPVRLARELGLSVDVVVPPSAEPVAAEPSLSIAGVQNPRRVLLGSEHRLHVKVRHEQMADQPLRLALVEDGQIRAQQTFRFAPGQAERRLSLAHRPASEGLKSYVLRLARVSDGDATPTGGVDAPLSDAVRADPYELTVRVLGRSSEVLVLEDRWRWSFKFLRRVLEEDPSFAFTAFLSRGPGIYMQFAEPDRKAKLGGFPQSRAELAWFDIFILGDVKPKQWSDAVVSALYELVVEEGKSLVFVAGPGTAKLTGIPQLDALMPVQMELDSAELIPGPVRLRVTPEGRGSPLFYQPSGEPQPASDWQNVSEVDQIFAPLRKRPGSTVLMEAPEHGNAFGPAIVLAEHTVGKGRVLYVGSDTLWKWQMRGQADERGNTPHTVFWQQALRALAPSPSQPGRDAVWVRTDRSRYTQGQTVHVTAEIEGTRDSRSASVDASVRLPDERVFPLALRPDPARDDRLAGRFEATVPGQYRIDASLSADGQPLAQMTHAVDVRPIPAESEQRGVNRALLDRLASATGGRVIDPADETTWPPPPPAARNPVRVQQNVDLWDGSWLLLALVGVLGLDWTLRLMRGFV